MDISVQLTTALAGRYEIERELGQGGMAVVYLARDVKHDRRVALKVLRSDAGGAQGTERFLREIRTAANLQHPHILPLHDSGEAAGHLFYVMPYVEGESLRQRLEREGPLPIADAVRLAQEAADALDHAHQRGFIHRDIKPENILLSGGHALVADFGIATAMDAAGLRLTETGLALGTPLYMSPEQATAAPNIDGRADQYALGCALYEMLAGSPPFTGPTGQAVMARHTVDQVPPLSTVRDVPVALEHAIVKSLAKLPADRWPTAAAFGDALQRSLQQERRPAPYRRVAILAAAGLLVVASAAGALRFSRGRTATVGAMPSVALLPFTVIGDTSRSHIAFGLVEALGTALVKVDGLRVPAFNATAAAVDDPQDAGRRLRVDMVLTGSVQIEGGRIRITPRLISVNDGINTWTSGALTGDLVDIFPMQDSIAERVVRALHVRLAPADRAAIARGVRTRDTTAYELYLRGRRAAYEFSKEGAERGIALLQQAVARDSLFADAWAALADAYYFLAQFGGLPSAEITSRIRTAVQRSIDLDSLNGYAYALRAHLRSLSDWDWDGARRDLRIAVRLSPASADVAVNYAVVLNALNEPDSALAQARRAVALDPANAFNWIVLAIRHGIMGRHDSAMAAARRAVALDSTQWVAHGTLASAAIASSLAQEGRRSLERLRRITGDSLPLALALITQTYRQLGDTATVRQLRDRLLRLAAHQYVPAIYRAMAFHEAGELSAALEAVEESARNHDLDLPWFIGRLTSLRGDPRYETVVRRVFGALPPPAF